MKEKGFEKPVKYIFIGKPNTKLLVVSEEMDIFLASRKINGIGVVEHRRQPLSSGMRDWR